MRVFIVLSLALLAAPAFAWQSSEPRKLIIDVDFAMANVNDDSLRWSLGRERVTKIPFAVLGLSGTLTPHLDYRIEINGADDTRRPAPFTPSDKTPFFFPNEGDPDYGVTSNPEGQFRVDDYKNTGWDPYLQEQHLRRAFIDAHTESGRFGVVAGRFFVPLGLGLDVAPWFTAKDLTHMQLIDALADTGAELYVRFGDKGGRHARLGASVITGNGNPYHDYVYFDFTGAANEDTNSAVGAAFDLRGSPLAGLEVVASAQFNFVGSRIEVDTTLQRSKHYDNKMILGASYRPERFDHLKVFAQVARYRWGLKLSSGGLLPGPPTLSPIDKDGYMVGADLSLPLPGDRGRAGVVFIREELDRDDSLIAFLAARQLLGVTLGEKERSRIIKVYAQLGPVMVFGFHNNVDNPFPQVSAIVSTSGPFAYQGPGNTKTGVGFRLKATF